MQYFETLNEQSMIKEQLYFIELFEKTEEE
jgi:hypothetical protein